MKKFEVLKNSQNLYKVKIYHNEVAQVLKEGDMPCTSAGMCAFKELLFSSESIAINYAKLYLEKLNKTSDTKPTVLISNDFSVIHVEE